VAQLGELDVAAADHAADFGESNSLAQRLQVAARNAEKEGVVFAAAQGQIEAVAQTAGGGSQRKRGAFDDGADPALVAQVAQVLEEAVADVDRGGRVTGGEKAFADERLRAALRAGGRWRRLGSQTGGGAPQRADDGQGVAGPGAVPRQRAAGLAEGDRKSTRLNSSHGSISYAVFCLKKKIT